MTTLTSTTGATSNAARRPVHTPNADVARALERRIAEARAERGRVFIDADLIGVGSDALRYAAELYLQSVSPREGFLESVQRAYFRSGRLSAAQARGVLNVASARVQSPESPTAAPEAPRPSYGIADSIPDGRYAVVVGEELRFYIVRTWTRGNRRYLDRLHGSPADFRRSATNPTERAEALARIGRNPAVAAATFGRKVGRCARCFATLTDEVSRSRGIGPDCWAHYN